ncbi:MAG: DUF2063 domain-containing protein [Alphaproteobacteria bacterium]|nr:DUF2063 domain-containing protein [Alphaproteobacteria bacterium]
MTLVALQRAFVAALRDGERRAPAFIQGDASTKFGVYHNAYRARLRDALRENFEKTWEWLGDSRFDEAISRYIAACPPSSWTLADFGDRFAALLDGLYPADPEVGELAWLEWEMHRAFIGADAAPARAETLGDINWENARLRFVPTLRLRPVSTNAGAIWSALAAGETPPAAEALPASAALCVWRRDLRPSFRTIDAREFMALRTALSGVSFGDLCKLMSAGREDHQTVVEIGSTVARWLADEMITEISAQADEFPG